MHLILWKKELECGIEQVDRQHRQVIEAINTFYIRHKCGKDRQAAAECMGFLQQYILYHFQYEEAIQLRCNFPLCREHQALHKGLATQVKFFSVKLESSGYAQEEVSEFCTFLAGWITNHILKEDMKFVKYYRQNFEQA